MKETKKKTETEIDPYQKCLYCGEDVETDDVCGYCAGPTHEECAEKHEAECEDNPDVYGSRYDGYEEDQ